jgi:hypothetical protein
MSPSQDLPYDEITEQLNELMDAVRELRLANNREAAQTKHFSLVPESSANQLVLARRAIANLLPQVPEEVWVALIALGGDEFPVRKLSHEYVRRTIEALWVGYDYNTVNWLARVFTGDKPDRFTTSN